MNRTSMLKWRREFKNGRTSVHDDQRSGRPSILTDDIVEKIENALRDDRRFTVDELSPMFPQISRPLLHETISETLGYRKLSARWVPKQLTDQHKLNRVEAGQEFLRRYKLHGDEFLRSIVTGDETWVEKSFQPTRSSEEGEDREVGRKGDGHSFLRSTLYNSYRLPSVEANDYYAALLNRFNNILKKKRPHLAKKKVLYQDNVRVHTCPAPMAKFNKFCYELLPQPTYSPDLALCDYFLFPNLKKWFGGKRYTTREQLIVKTEAYFEGLDKSYYSDLKKLENQAGDSCDPDGVMPPHRREEEERPGMGVKRRPMLMDPPEAHDT
ncbi:SETMR methyltransferase, partial [Pseudoatta argentina]